MWFLINLYRFTFRFIFLLSLLYQFIKSIYYTNVFIYSGVIYILQIKVFCYTISSSINITQNFIISFSFNLYLKQAISNILAFLAKFQIKNLFDFLSKVKYIDGYLSELMFSNFIIQQTNKIQVEIRLDQHQMIQVQWQMKSIMKSDDESSYCNLQNILISEKKRVSHQNYMKRGLNFCQSQLKRLYFSMGMLAFTQGRLDCLYL
ncbi:transmembrane protein, putative (macronuclear) [Tetrahymena thermophila SB210]|uniref:Transmembrane protein, putative n=1 Tax=Tetrahymena thermophila (strain SB210) TaxID=312017 RepID=Q23U70_TETTS|nr:transmembrane protein, putative [Tetrahymena thermophila SB210]EAS00074.2 transmembrane protein, putative [Tetrahymena thermophila SB210]|eukprot:XP_001020319.2 transmembrane protein, putative [Tetrahymena thermophila SB210]